MKFQEFISNKQITELQEQLEQARSKILKLEAQQQHEGQVDDIYILRDRLIKVQNENFKLKNTLKYIEQNQQYNKLDAFYDYFNIPNVQNMDIKLQMIVDKFINLRQEIESKNQTLLEYSQIQIQNKELFTKVTVLEQQLKLKESQIEKTEKQIIKLSKLIEQLQVQATESFWDLRIKCDKLKSLISDGWECDQKTTQNDDHPQKVAAIISEQHALLSKRFSQPISDHHAYFKLQEQTLYIVKQISCTSQPIQQIKKQIEALDEFWLMFILVKNYPIIILNDNNININNSELFKKVQFMKQLLNSESPIYFNQEVAYEMNIDFQNLRFEIAQFAQQSFGWFFEQSNDLVIVSEYNKRIKLSGTSKVKQARECTLLHYITDYYQITQDNRVMICIQSNSKDAPKVSKQQVNTGVVAKIKNKDNYNKVCQIINSQITQDTAIQYDENYVYVYL
ncbi:unnamed protein product (macronuclear) [Paramecium tetraurelia]|uniref:Uncharacterized protein n=1 Tax=Paramecium tetraurelia TaxID=5888 RepID=A0D4J4_PARTE|nr:uncharacterized protein GSPATT00013427001 [Paramecium tetraurelia]CAK77961.1 unnamed protein product [Paramecium tetraurelia]|eukprot:XP_001445358.1 hypothetical protein (macronuclear) [Paramecium tetraurelia strain d4-2]